jgi:exonuclease III
VGHPEQQQQQQQHWLFHSELDLINEIHPNLAGTGKSVDMNDPILPNSMPRDYGGVAILWKKSIDQYIRPTSDGSERIQCIEINTETSHLIINVYLPTKSNNDQFDTYSDCFDQLYEIVQKYSITHEIIIAGDFNEDISTKINNSRRAVKLRTFMEECNLATNTNFCQRM